MPSAATYHIVIHSQRGEGVSAVFPLKTAAESLAHSPLLSCFDITDIKTGGRGYLLQLPLTKAYSLDRAVIRLLFAKMLALLAKWGGRGVQTRSPLAPLSLIGASSSLLPQSASIASKKGGGGCLFFPLRTTRGAEAPSHPRGWRNQGAAAVPGITGGVRGRRWGDLRRTCSQACVMPPPGPPLHADLSEALSAVYGSALRSSSASTSPAGTAPRRPPPWSTPR